jgi:hypothetical protein
MIEKLFPNWYFKNKIYNVFIQQIQNRFKQNKAIFLFEIGDDTLTLNMIFNEKMSVFKKNQNLPLSYSTYVLEEDIQKLLPQLSNLKSFKELVLILKNDGEAVESQHIIEFLNNNLKNMTNYYKFNRKEISFIYEKTISENINFYKANPPAIVLETSANKWID